MICASPEKCMEYNIFNNTGNSSNDDVHVSCAASSNLSAVALAEEIVYIKRENGNSWFRYLSSMLAQGIWRSGLP